MFCLNIEKSRRVNFRVRSNRSGKKGLATLAGFSMLGDFGGGGTKFG